MKLPNAILASAALAATLLGTSALRADDSTKPTPYPLKTCLVSGEKVGEMGPPPVLVYKGQEIKFCCPDCVKDFKKDPDKYMKKLQDEQAKLKAGDKK